MTEAGALFWDGYGLGAPNSGVFVHARSLASELAKAGFPPVVVGARRCVSLFPDLQTIELPAPVFGPSLAESKLLGSRFVARAIVERRRSVEASQGAISARYIVHGLSNFNIPLAKVSKGLRRVLTVHDLIPLLAPHLVSRALVLQLKVLLPRALRVADRIICVSEWTRRTLIEWMPEVASKTRVIPNGIRAKSAYVASAKATSKDKIDLLFVARFERYKGHVDLLRWLRHSKLPLRLTLITDLRGNAFCREQAAELLAENKLILRQSVYGEELEQAYRDADVYVSPSQYEGFCLPAVEAMEAGKPVVYRPGSGIDEVAGTAVNVPLESSSPDAWDEAINKALARARSPQFGSELDAHLASLSSWKDAASGLISLYNELV